MPKTDNKCWSCGQPSMVQADMLPPGWQKCSRCGATALPNPTSLGPKTLLIEKAGEGKYDTKYRPQKKRLPRV